MELIGEKREGEVSLTSREGGLVTIDETYHYIVRADTVADDRQYVSQCPGLPIVGQTLSAGGLAICKTKTGRRRSENALIWDFTCSFSSEVEENDQTGSQPGVDPQAWIPVRKTTFERIETVEFFDTAGNAAKASNGEWYKEGIRRRRWLPVWEFSQFESASITDEDMADRNETVNASTFKGKAAKTLLLTIVDSTVGFYYGQRRRWTQYRIVYNKDTWREKRIDYGSYYLDGSGNPQVFTDKKGLPLPFGYLDNSGGLRAANLAPLTNNFDVFATDSWSFLRI